MRFALSLLSRRGRFYGLVVVLLASLQPAPLRAQTIDWIRQFGTSSNDDAQAVAADANAVYVVGTINSGSALPGQSSAGGQDAYVRKYDIAGSEQWTRQFGSSSDDQAWGVAVAADGVYVAGYTAGSLSGQSSAGGEDAFIRKYGLNGNEQWTRQFGSSSDDQARGVAVAADGVYVAGYTFGSLPGQTSAGQEDAFLRKYDSNGTEMWTQQFGSPGSEVDTAVAVGNGAVYVSGTTSGAFPGQTHGLFNDVYVRKYDAGGNEQWTRQFGSTGSLADDVAGGVAVDASGVYVVGGTQGSLPGQTSTGGQDAFVRKYDTDGTELWTHQFGDTQSQFSTFSGASGVAVTGGGVHVAGDTTGTLTSQANAGEEDIYVRKYDANGTELWTQQFGSDKSDQIFGAAANSSDLFAAGETSGALSGQSSSGQQDAYVFRLSAPVVCSYGITPQDQSFPAAGGTGSVSVSAPGGCPWTASINDSFLSITAGASGSGNGTVEYTVAANSSASQRTGTLTIANQTFTVTQEQASCSYILTPTSQTFPAAGGSGNVSISTQGECSWAATSNAAFLTITTGTSGTGTGVVDYSVASNPSSSARFGTLTIADQTFTVNQSGAGCTYSIDPTSQTFAAEGGTGSITVSAPDGCLWMAGSNASFLTVTAGASGNGNGTVDFSVDANTSTSERTGALLIADLTFTVTQQGAPPPTAPVVNEGGVVNNASYAASPAPVAPGSIAAVFGQNLNDGSTVLFSSYGQNRKLVTSLGGASVTINGIDAPMFYSTPGQLGIQIPFELAGGTSATIVVTVGGQSSSPRTFNLAEFTPGVFTLNQQGTGTAAALHEDSVTPITTDNPAHPNEVVVLYATGMGELVPALETGAPSVGNTTVISATATVDGVEAAVEFSGSAPGFVGLNQVNVRIPPATRTAPDIPVVLSIGGQTSNMFTIPVGP